MNHRMLFWYNVQPIDKRLIQRRLTLEPARSDPLFLLLLKWAVWAAVAIVSMGVGTGPTAANLPMQLEIGMNSVVCRSRQTPLAT